MDAQFAILTGQTATTGNGLTAASPADSGDFDVLLAAASGVAPVAPVQPITGRSGMPAPQVKASQSNPSAAGSALSGNASTPIAGSASAGAESVAAASTANGLPASASGLAAAQSGLAAASGAGVSGQTSVPASPPPVLASQAGQLVEQSIGQTGAQLHATGKAGVSTNAGMTGLGAGSQAALAASGAPDAVSAQAATALPQGTLGVEPAMTGAGSKTLNAMTSAASVSATPIAGAPGGKNNQGNPAGTANKNAAAMQAPVPTAADKAASSLSAATPQTSPTMPGTPTPSETAALPIVQPEAGVQARRAADGGLTIPLPKSATHGQAKTSAPAASASGSSPALSGAMPKAAPALPQQAATPDLMPQSTIDDARAGKIMPDGRAAAPIFSETQSQPLGPDADGIELGQTRAAETARAAERPGTAAGSARFTPANAGALAAQIAAKFQNGERRFEIRMDPPELGRVAVRMQVGHDNRVQAVLSADRPETLQDMRQHIRELERALNEAGLELGEDGLSFELSQERDDTPNEHSGASAFSDLSLVEDRAGDVLAALPPRELYGFRLASSGGVDIRL